MKKRIIAAAVACGFLLGATAGYGQPRVAAQLLEDLIITEIKPDCYVVTHSYPWPANSLLVRMNNKEFVWADTPYTPHATDMVLRWLFVKYGQGVRVTEINTGFHIDNLGGNRELKRNRIPIHGSQLTCELLRSKSKTTMQKLGALLDDPKYKTHRDAYRSFVFVEPTKCFDINKVQTLRFGGEIVEIYYPGPTHTADNVVVWFPGKKLLFGTCMVLAADARGPGFIDDGNPVEWPKSLVRVRERYPRAEMVVPGHGTTGDRSLIDHTIEVLERYNNGKE